MINNNKEKNKKKFKLSVGRIILMICLVLLIGQGIIKSSMTEMNYNKFIKKVNAGKVETVDIDKESGKVQFVLKDDIKVYYTNYPYTDDFQEMLLKKNVKIMFNEKSWVVGFLEIALTPIMFIVLIMFLLKFLSGDSSKFLVEQKNKIKTRFSDVAGLDEIKEDLLFIAEMLKNKSYKSSGARVPRGILLQGPPGNGKTLLARAFAGETGLNFIAVNACDFGSKFVGVGSQNIKSLFAEAKKNSPCVIFIDEIDSVGSKRSSYSDSASREMNSILTALLNQMDGFTQNDEVLVIAATNRVDDLDEALIRPGRFDKHLVVGMPDKITRKAVFEKYTETHNLHSDVDFLKLATKTYGFSCSKIECVVNEAIIIATRNNHSLIQMSDFEEAILQMSIKGHVKKKNTSLEDEKKVIAYHEAGHAVATYLSDKKYVSSVTIRPTTSGAGGFTISENKTENVLMTLKDIEEEFLILYAGRAAEGILKNDEKYISNGSSQDIKVATNLAVSYLSLKDGVDYSQFGECGAKELLVMTKEVLADFSNRTWELLKDNWDLVVAVANELIKEEIITDARFIEIVNSVEDKTKDNLQISIFNSQEM